tara:strand:+ start:3626 stop:5167 length:1542 start_codon:yes stop_codon:yes gene_type:complete
MIYMRTFKLDNLKDNSLDCILDLKNFVENFVGQKIFNINLKKFSKLLNCDPDVLILKTKKLIVSEFDYKKNKFNDFSTFFNILKDFFIYLYIFFLLIFCSKKRNSLKTDIMLFNVDQFDEIEKFKKILKHYNHSVIITDKIFNLKNIKENLSDQYLKNNLNAKYENNFLNLTYKDKNEKISFRTVIKFKKNIPFCNECIKEKYQVFKFGFYLFFLSLSNNFNFLKIYNNLFYSYIRNYSIFKVYSSKYLIQDRVFSTCPIRNHIFKKLGGKIAACVQSHITEASISLYNDTDILFTFGDEQNSKNFSKELGSRIDKSFPVGSLRSESFFINSNESFHLDKKIDILIFGVNLFNWLYLNKTTYNNYYKFIEIMKQISLRYPNLKIFLKHHSNNYKKEDIKEQEILKESNIKYLSSFTNTYTYIKNTKLFFSFSSSMILETCGLRGSSYFIDPEEKNFVFFQKNKSLNKIRLSSFENVDEIIKKVLIEKKQLTHNFNDICMKSDNVSKLIVSKLN